METILEMTIIWGEPSIFFDIFFSFFFLCVCARARVYSISGNGYYGVGKWPSVELIHILI